MNLSPFDFIAQCPPALYLERGIVPALFLSGLAGSLTHCLGMCSPFVLAQVSALPVRNGKIPPSSFFQHALLPYHAGRITVYAALGAAGAWLMTFFSSFHSFHMISAALLALAGTVFLASVLVKTGWLRTCAMPRWIADRLTLFLRLPLLWRGYVLGLLLGFLPCGLLYAALLAATTTANPLLAAAAMAAFGIGTMPALLAVAFGGRKVIQLRPNWITGISCFFALLNAFTLFIMAGGLVS